MPIKYVPFVPEPVEGQAVLQNFNRVLSYKGNGEPENFIKRGMPLYEIEKVETVGKKDSGNMVIRGECISACAYLKENNIKVDLVYIDPPFASGADYAKKIYLRKNPKIAEAIKIAKQKLDNSDFVKFEEDMYGDVWNKEKYLNWMYENLYSIKSIMSEKASIFVHLDWHIGHYVKILLDEIFGENNFINEIVWYYENGGGRARDWYSQKHDTIFWYSLSDEHIFNIKEIGIKRNQDEGTFGGYFKTDSSGRRYQEVRANGKIYKYYCDELRSPDDVWNIPIIAQRDTTERSGYPTQKPEALLEPIIKGTSKKDMLVADFFGGSGVTANVANKLGRKFIHCDIGINSIQTTRDRLVSSKASYDICEIKDGVQLFRNPTQTMKKLKALIPGLKDDESLDSFWFGSISDSKNGTVPVYVPNLLDHKSKLLDEVTMNSIIHQAIPDLDIKIDKVIVYYVDITSLKEIQDFIKKDDSINVEIELRDLKQILDDVVVDDRAKFKVHECGEDLFTKYNVEIMSFVSDRVIKEIDKFNEKSTKSQITKGKIYDPITLSDNGLEAIEWLSVDCSSKDGEWHSDSEIKIDEHSHVICNGKQTKDFWDGKIYSEKKPLRLKIRNICGDESIYEIG